jgi:hypothetical protein
LSEFAPQNKNPCLSLAAQSQNLPCCSKWHHHFVTFPFVVTNQLSIIRWNVKISVHFCQIFYKRIYLEEIFITFSTIFFNCMGVLFFFWETLLNNLSSFLQTCHQVILNLLFSQGNC